MPELECIRAAAARGGRRPWHRSLGGRLLVPWLLLGLPAFAQHGHPLVGSWSGEWVLGAERQQRILLVLEYENDALSGSVYFGTRRVPLSSATLDPGAWTVRLEAAEQRADGAAVEYRIEGRVENLGSTTERAISGSLTRNGERGSFRVVMN